MALRWVELTGAIGAGKSALLPVTIETLESHHRRVVELPGSGSSAATGTGDRPEGASWRRSWHRLHAATSFGLGHPRLCALAARALLRAPIPTWHRRAIGTLVLKLAVADHELRDQTLVDAVVIDEGWVHRAVNLFAWDPRAGEPEVLAYLRSIPLPDVVVLVHAPEELRNQRIQERGLPKRLRCKPPEVVERFLVRSRWITDIAADWLEANDVVVLRIRNDGSLEETSAALADELSGIAPVPVNRAAAMPLVRVRWPFPLPRPDRSRLRGRGRREPFSPRLAAQISEVLSEFGLPPQRPTLIEGGGRSLTLRVRTRGGEAALKRYKGTVSADAISGQHAILEELARAGFPCPRLRRTSSGSTLLEHDEHRFDLTEFLPGYSRWDRSLLPRRESDQLRHDAGVALAVFHEVLREFRPPYEHESRVASDATAAAPPERLDVAIDRCLTATPPDGGQTAWRRLWDDVAEMRARLAALGRRLEDADLPLRVIHGDYGPYNLLIRRSQPLVVMDLELARTDWRLIDLARAIPRFATNRRGFSVARARRFLDGYRSHDRVPVEELRMMPSLLSYLEMRRAVVCWGRYEHIGDTTWLDAAVEHLVNAEQAESASFPLALVLMTADAQDR